MKRYFNTTGPCVADRHYLLPATARCREVVALIEREQYFVIHAARQSGKTTLLLNLRAELEAGGKHRALYCSLEGLQGVIDPKDGTPGIYRTLVGALNTLRDFDSAPVVTGADFADYTNLLKTFLQRLCAALDRPLVLLFDEVDCLAEGTLISFLRQLRDGFVNRAQGVPFPVSCALVGMRDIRDYKAHVRPDRDTLGSASPFNIAAESLTLVHFTAAEIATLYAQHTADTGQVFPPAAVARAYWWSRGQPWLVNALAREVVDKILEGDATRAVTADHFEEAAEALLCRRDTHLDSLLERLKEPRVRKIVEPVILGTEETLDLLSDDCQYVLDLGILKQERGVLLPANPIYAEVILRTLAYNTQQQMTRMIEQTPWIDGNRLDMTGMLQAFQGFWRENSEIWQARYEYREAAPHIILQAFLQRVINGGGQIVREYALGRQRLDLLVCWQGNRYALELKMKHQYRPDAAHAQFFGYLDRLGLTEGWLAVFDRNPAASWDAKLTWRTLEFEGKKIHVVGL